MNNRKPGFEIYRTSRIIKRYMDSNAAKTDIEKLTGTHGHAVGFFYNNSDRDIFQKDFEKEFDIRRSSASKTLALMENNGLIKREKVYYDARLKKITLTEKALKAQTIVEKAFEKMEKTMKEDISDEELEIFFRVIDKINRNLERSSEKK